MNTDVFCCCFDCHNARLLAAWAVLAESPEMEVRISARVLMNRKLRQTLTDEDLPMLNMETQAMKVCHDWILKRPEALRQLQRTVGVAGTPGGCDE